MLASLFGLAFLIAAADQPTAVDLDTSFKNLKAAEQSQDAEQVKKWAIDTLKLARDVLKTPEAETADDSDARKARLEYAKQVEGYAEYSLYAAALRSKDRVKMMDLFDTLERESPHSKYLPQLYGPYAAALTQSGAGAKAFQFAEKAISKDPANEDLLLILADGCMTRKQWDHAATYGVKLANVASSHAPPEGVSASDWERKRGILIGRGYYIAGMSYASNARYPQADTNLRAALPYIKGEQNLMAGALFYLGVANYNIARATRDKPLMQQALSYSQSATQIAGPYQQLAWQNVGAIKQELNRWR